MVTVNRTVLNSKALQKTMKVDEYTVHARIYPGLICSIPAFVLVAAFENETVTRVIRDVAAIEILGKFSVGVAVFVLLMQLSRFIGKDVFEVRLFNNELNFPTTDYLLASNSALSSEFKATLAQKIASEFGLQLPSLHEEQADEIDARNRVKDIVARIRASTSGAALVLQRNWEYGFARNLVGGSAIAAILSIVGFVVYFRTVLGQLFGICTVIFVATLVAGPWLLRRYAGHYAKQVLYAFAGDPR